MSRCCVVVPYPVVTARLIHSAVCAPRLAAEEQERIRIALARYEEQTAAEKRAKAEAFKASLATQVAMKCASDSADLNDPAALRKSRPAREGDFDARLGPSSAQVQTLCFGDRDGVRNYSTRGLCGLACLVRRQCCTVSCQGV